MSRTVITSSTAGGLGEEDNKQGFCSEFSQVI